MSSAAQTDWRQLIPVAAPRYVAGGETPSVVWPTDNELGVPLLDPTMQAVGVPAPVLTWGNVKRTTVNPGSWFFYTQDYRYTALWNDPRPVVNSQCAVAVEPNFSCYQDMPLAVGYWRIYQKRWLARWWQTQGVRILVDLNVAPKFAEANLLGVPIGWRAYATRGYLNRLEQTEREYAAACNRAQSDSILFVVYGGSRKVGSLCAHRGWIWIPECMDERRKARHRCPLLDAAGAVRNG